MPSIVRTGIDLIHKCWPKSLNNTIAGLLVHPASINSRMEHSVNICMKSKKFKIKAFFGPQHGIRGETQDNMIEWEGFRDPDTGLPVYSLYGKTRKPEPYMLNDIDVIIIDLQDIGARYYTFIWTMALVMEACLQHKKCVVVLDRPNPIGGHLIEGPVLLPDYSSFVGLHALPIRHGMTIGEIAIYLKDNFYQGLELYVIKMDGWKRNLWFDHTGLPWVLPSPNMPTLETAIVYPGMCLLEGTNLSEGRGTTRPFEIFGSPYINANLFIKRLSDFRLKGVFFRPLSFQPTFQKYAGKICGGVQIHVLNRETFRPFKVAVAILKTAFELYQDHFRWNQPPYEYEDRLLPIDILAGNSRLRIEIESGTPLDQMEEWWQEELRDFNNKQRKKYLLYK